MACKNNIILTSTCIISSVTCVVLTFWGQIKNNGTITTDSYIGIIASLIGVCATIVELRNLKQQIDQVEKQRKDLELYKTTISNEIHLSKTGMSNAFGILSVVEKGSLLGFAARVSSIVCDDLQATPITENLKYIHIPQNKENYTEIMKLHFDIITMMEKAKQNLVK